MRNSYLLLLMILGLVGGCASLPAPAETSLPPVTDIPAPITAPPPPAPVANVPPTPANKPAIARPTSQVAEVQNPSQGRALLARLLPSGINQRKLWLEDIFNAFSSLKIPYTRDYFCAAIAVIEQESSWQADPSVPGLGKMVWGQIAQKAKDKHIPLVIVQTALRMSSKDGRSYKQRIDALHTEREMNNLFEEMSEEAQQLGLPVSMQNPIRTGGPMQVSVAFAQAHISAWPYPYARTGSVRHEVFTRRGGLYFGIANLLHYRAPYTEMKYRFADYNAGRFSSRNAAFQAALGKLSQQTIALDGDLLRYENGQVSTQASQTSLALLQLRDRLGLSPAQIAQDLRLEKEYAFEQSRLYQQVFKLAERSAGKPLPRASMPQIRLHSPKIQRKLTTEWFAKRVDGRFAQCQARASK